VKRAELRIGSGRDVMRFKVFFR